MLAVLIQSAIAGSGITELALDDAEDVLNRRAERVSDCLCKRGPGSILRKKGLDDDDDDQARDIGRFAVRGIQPG